MCVCVCVCMCVYVYLFNINLQLIPKYKILTKKNKHRQSSMTYWNSRVAKYEYDDTNGHSSIRFCPQLRTSGVLPHIVPYESIRQRIPLRYFQFSPKCFSKLSQ